MSQANPSFYAKVTIHTNGVAGPSYTAIIPWVDRFEDVPATQGICVLKFDEGPYYRAGLYAQIPDLLNYGIQKWKLGIPYADMCSLVQNGSIVEIYLNVTTDQTFSSGYSIWRNGNLVTDLSLHPDLNSVWIVAHIAAGGGGSGTVNSVNNQLPDGTGNVQLSSTNLTDSSSLVRTSQLAVASGIATLGSDGKLTSTQLPTINVGVTSVAGRSGAVTLSSADLSDVASLLKTTSVGAANGVAPLDGTGHISTSYLPSSVLGAMNYQGTWNATTNVPTLSSGVGTKGFYYTVAVAGSTAVDGVSQWNVGDHITYNGTAWEKIDGIASEVITVAGRTGNVSLSTSDLTDFTSAVTTPLSNKVNTSLLGTANGVATLGSDGKVPSGQLPPSSNAVTSVAGHTGAVTLATTDLTDVTTAITNPLAARVLTSSVGTANGVASLDSGGKVPLAQIPSSVIGALNYQGTWNASSNSPTLASGVGTKGFYYTVSVAGTTTLDSHSSWNIGDHVAFNGTAWEKIDGVDSEVLSVAGRTGVVTISTSDLTDVTTAITNPLAARVLTSSVGVANGVASLDSGGKIPTAQLPSSVIGALNYQGTWNATSNTPTLASGVGTKGFYYTVATAGGTTLDGHSSWNIGDHVAFNGTVWEKIDGVDSEVLSVAGRTGVVTLSTSDLTDVASAITAPLAARVLTSAVGAANGVASLDSGGKIPTAQLPASVVGAMNYQGTWNASTNTPTLASSTGTKGFYYTVSVAGTTSLDGHAVWNAGDHVAFNGSVWEKIDGVDSEVLSVAGRTGAVTLSTSDLTDVASVITGPITTLQGQANPIAVALSATDTWKGFGAISGVNAGATITIWSPVYMGSAGTWLNADAASATTAPCRGLAVAAGSSGNPLTVLFNGLVRHDAWTWTTGGDVFLATGGGLTQTKPSASGNVVQAIGYAVTATEILVNMGSFEYLTLT